VGLYLVAAFDWQALANLLWMIGSVACGLGFVIFVHELGHFLVAKWCGVKCEKFYVGFDVPISIFGFKLPSKLLHFQWGETEYGVGIIPLGGYVKMLGQDDDPRVSKQREELARIRIKQDADGSAAGAKTEAESAILGEVEREGAQPQSGYQLDPRSFPAKTVLQRMAIISAGVIMNLIFAVVFAAVAFRAGVPYTPCEVGATVPGEPAWTAGIEPGTRFIQIGENGRRSEALRFDWDLRQGVAMAGDREDLYLVTRLPDGTEQSLRVRPSVAKLGGLATIGIIAAHTNTLGATFEGTSAAAATPPLQGGDTVVAVDGQSVQDWRHLQVVLAQNPDQPVTLSVERAEEPVGSQPPQTTKLEVVVPPNRLKRIGVVVKAGPIVAIRPGSPAEAAGFQVGDVIEAIAGEPLGDPLSLPERMRAYHDQEVGVEVRRPGPSGQPELVSLTVTPEVPTSFDWTFSFNSPMASEALGLAFEVQREITAVIPGSPAEEKGVQAGESVVSVQFLLDEPPQLSPLQRLLVRFGLAADPLAQLPNHGEPIDLAKHDLSWTLVFNNMQTMREHETMKLWLQHGSQIRTVELKPIATDEFNPDRGLVFRAKSETYTAKTWSEALVLGVGRTKEDATRVFGFVTKLFTGKIPLTNVGGPLSIAYIAGSEASEGLPRLLIFLTFLSANLAVVNFLPIPALDGGHFLFLLWEGISGRPASERVQIALTLAGVACLLCFMVFIFALDIQRMFL